ncbi:Zinc-binding oxidoreductase protein [Lasiodiplodia theobromae]|nr:Zinc-binding oxidoreductase protein [Lasiodiplodia theobromae]KAF4540202.1 Zinc-binding oxidoreductase protein [Lasiodiplodia theobromae]
MDRIDKITSSFHASLGAFITIFALAIDPFSQQIIKYYNCLQPVPDTAAKIPITNNFTGLGALYGDTNLNSVIAVATYTGLFGPPANTSVSITVDCPTGNCTFPNDSGAAFSSLDVCHSCQDISALLINITDPEDQSYYNVTLESSGAALQNRNITDLVSLVGSDYYSNDTVSFYDFDAVIHRKNDYLAISCSLYPCVTTYSAKFVNSVYTESRISSLRHDLHFENVLDNDEPWSLAVNQTLRNGTWNDCNPSATQTPTNYVPVSPNNMTISATYFSGDPAIVSKDTQWYPPDCVYMVGYDALLTFMSFIEDIFSRQTLTASSSSTGAICCLQDLWHNDTATMATVDRWVNGLATSLSGAMRVHGNTPPPANFAYGTVMGSQTCVDVRWAWIGLPAALYGLTIVFIVTTALHTRGDGREWTARHWKSSAVALLLHGFDPETRRELGGVRDRGEMSEAAERVMVQLRHSREGDANWWFARAKG